MLPLEPYLEVLRAHGLTAALQAVGDSEASDDEKDRICMEVLYTAGHFPSFLDNFPRWKERNENDVSLNYLAALSAVELENWTLAERMLLELQDFEREQDSTYFDAGSSLLLSYIYFRSGDNIRAKAAMRQAGETNEAFYLNSTTIDAPSLRKLISASN